MIFLTFKMNFLDIYHSSAKKKKCLWGWEYDLKYILYYV